MVEEDTVPDNAVPDDDEHERAAKLDAALAESQRVEREERDADFARQARTDDTLSKVLSERPTTD